MPDIIRGHSKASAYFETGDGEQTWSGECRQCCHCQFTWEYRPGSGITRGYCLRHDGWLCGRPECEAQQTRLLARLSHLPGSTDRHCVSFVDYVEWLRDQFTKDRARWTVLPSGIVVRTG
jgi:hypothetical protein